jgi:hypothetical protein
VFNYFDFSNSAYDPNRPRIELIGLVFSDFFLFYSKITENQLNQCNQWFYSKCPFIHQNIQHKWSLFQRVSRCVISRHHQVDFPIVAK